MEKIINREYHQWFDSFEEMEKELPKMVERQPSNVHTLRLTLETTRAVSWLGCKDAPTMMKNIREGWPECAKLIRECASQIDASLDLTTVQAMTIDVRRRKRMRRDYGDELHMSRVWNGDLEHAWDRPERVPRRAPSQRYATVFVDLTAAAAKSAMDGKWRAACAMKLNDLLTSAGISTEIWVGNSTGGSFPRDFRTASRAWFGIKVKEYTQPLNEDRLAALTSVGTLRTVGFAMIAAAPFEITAAFGMPLNIGLPLPLRERREKGERVIRIGECWDVYAAKREVAAVAAALAPKEFEEATL